MLRLNLDAAAAWVDLGHGVRLKCLPASTTVMAAARKDAAVAALGADASEEDLGIVMAKAVARRVIVEWEGVGDENGEAIAVSPDGVDALLDVWPLFDAFQTRYLAKAVLLDREKNASALSPSGTTAGVKATARPAKGRARSARPKSTRR